jgi:leucyl aminopeptidase
MSKLKIELIIDNPPGYSEEEQVNERKARDIQYLLDEKLLKIYLGPKKNINVDKVREKLSEVNWKDLSETEIELNIANLSAIEAEAIYEMISLKSFIFDKYKTKDRSIKIKKIAFKPQKPQGLDINIRNEIIDAVKFCRDIVSSNADTINPAQMERFAKDIAAKSKHIKCTVIDAKKAEKLGLNCLLAVGQESLKNSSEQFHPRLVLLEYNPITSKKKQEHIVLVGKGITFDTGGLCLKPTNYMLDMKSDMAGAAAVLSVFHALINLAPYVDSKVTGIMALAENAFGSASYKPGDILQAYNGKTIQVVDTDAEGRLVLADALSYVKELEKPTQIIDLATLTGSMVSTLGEVAAGAMGDKDLFDKLSKFFDKEGEKLWYMPLYEQYRELLDSDIADIAHCSGKPDALCAGIFLKEFVPKGPQWLHLDIAGVGFIENDGLWAYKGATGFGVKGLLRYLLK